MARQIRKKSGTCIYHIMLRDIEEYKEILDIENESPKQLSDDDVKDFLLHSEGISNPLMIQSLEKVRRNEVLIAAKRMGAGLRQLSRLTGVSFGVIQKL